MDNKLPTVEEVENGILRAATAFSELSCKGGYLYLISADPESCYNSGHGVKHFHITRGQASSYN